VSDPNDIIQRGRLPSRLEKVAEAGGFEERAKERELELQKEVLEKMSKIKPQAWKAMGETIVILKDFVDDGVIGGFKDIGQDLKDSLSLTVQEALSPLKNEVEQAFAEALEPIMPEIQAFTMEKASWFRIAIGTWEAVIKGQWDDVLQDISDKMPDWFKRLKNDFRDRLDEMFANLLSGSIEGLSNMPGLPTGVGTGFDIAQAIVAAWTGFWSDLGWQ